MKTKQTILLLMLLVAGAYQSRAQLAGGTYTINSATPTGGTNFISFADAISAMTPGITGPVVFNVVAGSGPYTEQVNIGSITGASATNTIRFNGNGSTVQYTPTTTYTGILMMNGAKYVKFDSLTFKSLSTTYGYGAILYNACDFDSITRCTFDLTTVTTTASANSMGIRISTASSSTSSTGSGATNSYLANNKILGTTGAGGPYYGFYFYGPNSNNIYKNNYVSNYYYYAIYDYYGDHISYLDNTITRETKTTQTIGYYGFYLYYTKAGSVISGNKVRNLGGATQNSLYCYPISLLSSTGTAADPVIVSNNLIYNMTSLPTYGIRLSSSDYVNVYHNTVLTDIAVNYTGTSYGIYVASSDYCNVTNNIVTITEGGTSTKYGLYFNTSIGTTSDYNDVYINTAQTGTAYFGYYNSNNYLTQSAFQSAVGFEMNGSAIDPVFAAPGSGNYTPTNTALIGTGTNLLLSVPVDINKVARAANSTPGAFEAPTTACSGKPVAGTIVPNPNPPCPNQLFRMRTVGGTTTATSNIIYQWQDSTSSGWQNSLGTTATTYAYSTTINTPTRFRVILYCSNSNQSDTSKSYLVTPAPFINCYCTPIYSGSTTSIVTNVTLLNLNNSSSGSAPYYSDYTSQQPLTLPIPVLTMGRADTVSIKMGTNSTNYSGVWIDFNHSSTFETNEYFSLGTSVGASGTARIPMPIPLTALPGNTRMRIRSGDAGNVTATMACGSTSSGNGEAEDYYVTIVYPPCSGPLNGGTAYSDKAATCVGYTVNLWDSTHDYNYSQIDWNWQNSFDGGSTWNDIPNTNKKDTLKDVLITGAASYRVKMKCLITGDSSFSVPANIAIKPPYACYCYSQSAGEHTDVSDIGSFTIGNTTTTTGGPHILNPESKYRRTDYTDVPNIVLNTHNRYRLSVYHIQNNALHQDARISVFIDFNNDLVYDVNAPLASELVFTGVTTEAHFYIDTTITIPDAVIPNVPTGLRVILNNDLNPLAPANLGCGGYESGETEDYVVTLRRVPQSVGGVNATLSALSLYPNPSNGAFTIQAVATANMGTLHLAVTNVNGQTVWQEEHSNISQKFNGTVDLRNMASGLYFLEVRTASGDKLVKKLVIQ